MVLWCCHVVGVHCGKCRRGEFMTFCLFLVALLYCQTAIQCIICVSFVLFCVHVKCMRVQMCFCWLPDAHNPPHLPLLCHLCHVWWGVYMMCTLCCAVWSLALSSFFYLISLPYVCTWRTWNTCTILLQAMSTDMSYRVAALNYVHIYVDSAMRLPRIFITNFSGLVLLLMRDYSTPVPSNGYSHGLG